MSKVVIAIIVVLLVGGGAFYYFRQSAEAPTNVAATGDKNNILNEEMKEQIESMTAEKNSIIKITDSGFSPKELRVKQGTVVIFENETGETSAPASAKHPEHTVYPGSDINKCGTAEQSKIFDSCAGIPAGKMWSFTFNEKGSWGYHDHLKPQFFGKIIVE